MSAPFVNIKWKYTAGRGVYIKPDTLSHMVDLAMWSYTGAVYMAAFNAMREMCDQITIWMKANAPWTDRTTRARSSLQAKMANSQDRITGEIYGEAPEIIIGYLDTPDPVFYSWYLETNYAGKYQIILPTLDKWAGEVFERIKARTGLR